MGLGDRQSTKGPPPAVGATLIAAAAVVLVLGMAWLARDDGPDDHLVVPTADGITMPTDGTGEPIELPPSQPATAVSFGADGQIIRPDPVRARVIDESGAAILVPLAPNTTVDTITGEIVNRPPATTGPGGTPTTGGTTPTTVSTPTSTDPPPTDPPTTPSTEPPTTTDPTTSTTDPTTSTSDPGLGALLDALLP